MRLACKCGLDLVHKICGLLTHEKKRKEGKNSDWLQIYETRGAQVGSVRIQIFFRRKKVSTVRELSHAHNRTVYTEVGKASVYAQKRERERNSEPIYPRCFLCLRFISRHACVTCHGHRRLGAKKGIEVCCCRWHEDLQRA